MSAPSGPIQTPMPGYLSLLNLKNRGLFPDTLTGTVQATQDIDGYFLRGSLVNYTTSLTRSFVITPHNNFFPFTPNSLVVPDTETWYVERVSLRCSAGGAGAVVDEYSLGFQLPGGSNPYFFLGEKNNLNGAAKSASVASAADFWLPPGAILGLWVGSVTVAGADFQITGLRYAPLKV